ncbi:putative bark agglutinin LECRPA3 [Arachis stenosperma]|uniref:putative bark agglutinin LECRPA3 n=1 Tax=Arachis stenosperma TaxID=217475 RepID=UPI0025AC1C7E|nr:putative bark agglutinin LECRPA3 [Arachis stenosperma]
MDISYSSHPNPKPFYVVLAICFLFLANNNKVNAAKVTSFNFTKFSTSNPSITLQGSSEILGNGVLALTNRENPVSNTGRVLYATPVTIWDKATGNVASFVTSFSFVVEDAEGDYISADGIIFFLAPQDTEIPNNSSGGFLGVVDSSNALNQFVGVEFDTYTNEWDPDSAHVGIDVNSLISLKTVKWNRVSGSLVRVSIIYDSLSKTLSVSVTNKNGRITTVSQVVDLKAVLPEKVRVGLSATTTTGGVEAHDIYSWSFTSNLETTTSSTMNNIATYA